MGALSGYTFVWKSSTLLARSVDLAMLNRRGPDIYFRVPLGLYISFQVRPAAALASR